MSISFASRLGAFILLAGVILLCAPRLLGAAPAPDSTAPATSQTLSDVYVGWRTSPALAVVVEEVPRMPIDRGVRTGERFLGSADLYAHPTDDEIRTWAQSVGATRVLVSRTFNSQRWCIGKPPPGWNPKIPYSRLRFFAPAETANVSGYPPEWADKCRARRADRSKKVSPADVSISDYDSIHVLPLRDGQHGQIAQIDIDEWDESFRSALDDFAADYGCDRVILWERRQSSNSDSPPANPNLSKSILLYRVPLPNPYLEIEPPKQ